MSADDRSTLAAQVAARGANLVLQAPPSPAWAGPVLAALASRLPAAGPVLGLCPTEAIDESARVASQAARGGSARIAAAHTPGRISRLLLAGHADLIFLTPELALDLVRRSVLKLDSVAGVLLLFPESFGGDETLAVLLQDVPREVQRLVVTADPVAVAPLIERYCWRAPSEAIPGFDAPPVTELRTCELGWRRRLEALPDLVDQLDPGSLAVWTAGAADAAEISRSLEAAGVVPVVTSGLPPASELIIAYDVPTPGRLAELVALGPVLLLSPPGSDRFMPRLALRRRPIPLRGVVDQARNAMAERRKSVSAQIDAGATPEACLAIAPLLERYEAGAVAAALYDLWQTRPAPAAAPAVPSGPSAKLWIGIGRKDEVSPNDLVAALSKDGGLPREAIGKVEIRETFSLVELRGADPAQVAERLTGKSIRKRRLVARPDKKQG